MTATVADRAEAAAEAAEELLEWVGGADCGGEFRELLRHSIEGGIGPVPLRRLLAAAVRGRAAEVRREERWRRQDARGVAAS
jgi:hypothetical protein